MSKAKKRGPGRPRIEFDLEIVEGLGRIGATAPEMACVLPASQSTIEHRMADRESDFSKRYRKGQGLLKASIRRKQIAVGLAGNVTMLIWLGKQHLAQQERVTVDSVDLKVTLDKFVAAAEQARKDGDQSGVEAVLAAIGRIEDGEPAEMVYLEWLRAQQAPQAGDGESTGR